MYKKCVEKSFPVRLHELGTDHFENYRNLFFMGGKKRHSTQSKIIGEM